MYRVIPSPFWSIMLPTELIIKMIFCLLIEKAIKTRTIIVFWFFTIRNSHRIVQPGHIPGPATDSFRKLTHNSFLYLHFIFIFFVFSFALAILDTFLIFQDCLQWSPVPRDCFFISLLSKLYNSNHLSLSTHLLVFAFLPLCWIWCRNPLCLLSPLPVHCPKLSPTVLSILSVRVQGPLLFKWRWAHLYRPHLSAKQPQHPTNLVEEILLWRIDVTRCSPESCALKN